MWRRKAAEGCLHELSPAVTTGRSSLAHSKHPLARGGTSIFTRSKPNSSSRIIGLSTSRGASPTFKILAPNNPNLRIEFHRLSQTNVTKIRGHRVRIQKRYTQTTQPNAASEVKPEVKAKKPPWWRNMSPDFKVALWSYLVMGTTGWVFLGTTTLVSVLIWSANTLKAQGLIADMLSKYLTRETGLSISFATAIVPRWKEGRIRLTDVKVEISEADALKYNCSELHLFVKEIDVKLSAHWFVSGKGLLSELLVKGVAGSVDRRRIVWPTNYEPAPLPNRSGFVLEKLVVEDAHIVIHNPRPDRPLLLDIFSLQCRIFRSSHLLQDLLYADYAHGSFDDCLFTLTKEYKYDVANPRAKKGRSQNLASDEEIYDPEYMKKILKISGIPVDHISETATGPVSWLTNGAIDLRVELLLPKMDFEAELNRPVTKLEEEKQQQQQQQNPLQPDKEIKMKYDVVLSNISADVPLSTPHLSYLKSALIQPIVMYLNTNYTEFPMQFEFSIPQSRFKNAWYPGDVGFWDAISDAAGRSIVEIVKEKRNSKNLWQMLYYGGDGVVRGIRYCWIYFVQSFFALPTTIN